MLNEIQRRQLLSVARRSIEAVLAGRHLDLSPAEFDGGLQQPSGAFVTLSEAGQLRGCIGSIEPVAPLYLAVSSSAAHAAFRDPRFPPVVADEFAAIEIEISVLGPIEPVEDVAGIVVGRDGLIISRGRRAGLLLPQVASEYGWDRETFLRQTCVKAGLPPESWREADTTIKKFTAEVFDK